MSVPDLDSFFTYPILPRLPDQMIFEPPRRVPVPSSDILSYLFSDPPYDHDEPVRLTFDDTYFLADGMVDVRRCARPRAVHLVQSGAPTRAPARRRHESMGRPTG